MSFVHDTPEFAALLDQVSDHVDVAPALVEKDYWITHSLWALHETKLAIWFKGGTSLSKGLRDHRALLRGPRSHDRARRRHGAA